MDHSKTHPIRVLIVDDEPAIRELIAESLSADARISVVGTAADGASGVEQALKLSPDVVLMDVNMPKMGGRSATARIVAKRPDTRVIALTGQTTPESITKMILAGAVGYAVKGADPHELAETVIRATTSARFIDAEAVPGLFDSVVQLAREQQRRRAQAERLAEDLQRAYDETVHALGSALRHRDLGTNEHGDRVADRVAEVGRTLGLGPEQMTDLKYGAIFHDIGKIAVPDAILHNTDDLTEDQWRIIRQHTVAGEEILRPISFLRNVGRIVRHSHEHWDGSGYPDELRGEQIPIESRIVFACDAFDAMTSHRSYQAAMSRADAMTRLRKLAGTHFDPHVVDVLLQVLEQEQAASCLSSPP